MAFVIDISNASAEKLGNAHGLSRQALTELSPAYAQMNEVILQQTGYLPHIDSHKRLQNAKSISDQIDAHMGPLIVIGDSGVLSALRAHSAKGLATWISDPSPDALSSLPDLSDALIVALDGPVWVRDIVQALLSEAASCMVFIGDGGEYDGWRPDGVEIVEENGVADIRFAPFSSFGLALALLSGCEADALLKAIELAQSRVLQEALYENPAFLLSALFTSHDRRGSGKRAQLVFAEESWLGWADWAASVWSAFSNQEYEVDGRRRRYGGECTISRISNESHVQQMLIGPNEQMTLMFLADYPLLAQPNPMTQVAWEWNKILTDGYTQTMQECRRPLCQITIDNLGLHHLYELSYIWLHSALVTSALRVEDPLQMKGADRFRKKVAELAVKRSRQE